MNVADQVDVEDCVARILRAIEPENIELRAGLQDTPVRVRKMYEEMFDGYAKDPGQILNAQFDGDDHLEQYDEMVIVKDIQFFSHCEHHMCPFFGEVHVGYIPNGKVVGLSKLARLTEMYAHRLQVQERMTAQITSAIEEHLSPKGVIVVVEAFHTCMSMRGAKSPKSKTVTSKVRGLLHTNYAARAEFLSLLKG